MEVKVYDMEGKEVGTMDLSEDIFAIPVNVSLMHEAVKNYLANQRQGTQSTLTRTEVRGGGKKPWRQKGTGRARAGMSSSPLWRGGGRAFPNSPDQNFSHKVNKKMYRAGVCSILSQLAREDRLTVIDQLAIDAPKTKMLAQKLKEFGFGSVLVITDSFDENLYLASRNLPNVLVVEPHQADPVSLVHFKDVLITKAALGKIEEMLA